LGCDNLICPGEGQDNGVSPALKSWEVFDQCGGQRWVFKQQLSGEPLLQDGQRKRQRSLLLSYQSGSNQHFQIPWQRDLGG
jgi:hypothetical protein